MQQKSLEPVSQNVPRWLSLLIIARPMWWFVWMTPFTFGYLIRPEAPNYWIVIFMCVWVTFTEGIICLLNEVNDRIEDSINFPERGKLLDTVGIDLVFKITKWPVLVCAYILSVLTTYPMGGIYSFILLSLSALIGIFYEKVLILKKKAVIAEISIGFVFLLLFWGGYVWGTEFRFPPLIIWLSLITWILTCFMKDLPDVKGDVQAGRTNVFEVYHGYTLFYRALYASFIFFTPFILLWILFFLKLLPITMLWVTWCLLITVLIWLHVVVVNLTDKDEGTVVYQESFTYVHFIIIVQMVAWDFRVDTLLIGVALFTARVILLFLRLDPRIYMLDLGWKDLWLTWKLLNRRSTQYILKRGNIFKG